jgi:hypothetical protein
MKQGADFTGSIQGPFKSRFNPADAERRRQIKAKQLQDRANKTTAKSPQSFAK